MIDKTMSDNEYENLIKDLVVSIHTQQIWEDFYQDWGANTDRKNPSHNVKAKFRLVYGETSILFAKHWRDEFFIGISRDNDKTFEILEVFPPETNPENISKRLLEILDDENIDISELLFSHDRPITITKFNMFTCEKDNYGLKQAPYHKLSKSSVKKFKKRKLTELDDFFKKYVHFAKKPVVGDTFS